MASVGELNTLCIAIVISTTPRLGPRWPPVFETVSIRKERISSASSLSSRSLRPSRSFGDLICSSMLGSTPLQLFLCPRPPANEARTAEFHHCGSSQLRQEFQFAPQHRSEPLVFLQASEMSVKPQL